MCSNNRHGMSRESTVGRDNSLREPSKKSLLLACTLNFLWLGRHIISLALSCFASCGNIAVLYAEDNNVVASETKSGLWHIRYYYYLLVLLSIIIATKNHFQRSVTTVSKSNRCLVHSHQYIPYRATIATMQTFGGGKRPWILSESFKK